MTPIYMHKKNVTYGQVLLLSDVILQLSHLAKYAADLFEGGCDQKL